MSKTKTLSGLSPQDKLIVIDDAHSTQLVKGKIVTFVGYNGDDQIGDIKLAEHPTTRFKAFRFRKVTPEDLLAAATPPPQPATPEEFSVNDYVTLREGQTARYCSPGLFYKVTKFRSKSEFELETGYSYASTTTVFRLASDEEAALQAGRAELREGDMMVLIEPKTFVQGKTDNGQAVVISATSGQTLYYDSNNYTAERHQVRPVSRAELIKRFNSGVEFHFTRGKNLLSGNPGWRPSEITDFDFVPPDMVLHDMFEHEPGTPATPEEEFRALGVTLLLRHEGGYYKAKGTRFSDAIKTAYAMLYFRAHGADKPAKKPTAICPDTMDGLSAHQPLPVDTELEMQRALTTSRDFIRGHEKFRGYDMSEIDAGYVQALGWMRLGYRLGQRRFQGIDIKKFSGLYLQASTHIESLLAQMPDGGVMKVVCYPEQYKVSVEALLSANFTG